VQYRISYPDFTALKPISSTAVTVSVVKSTLIGITPMKTKMCGAKDSGNPRSKCLQATTHTRAKQNDAKH